MSENLSLEEKRKIFEESKKDYLKQKEKENERKGGYERSYEEIHYTPILYNDYSVIRIVDGFYTPKSEQRLPTSPKKILRSYIIGDEGKGMFVIWNPDKSWFLWRVYNKVLSYTWNRDIGDNGAKEYIYKNKFPTLFERVRYNGKNDRRPYERGWYPKSYITMNVIDRKDSDWHIKNKHTKVLTKNINENNGMLFAEPGIPPSVYDANIFQTIVETYGFVDDYDIAIRKIKILEKGAEQTKYEAIHSNFLKDRPEMKYVTKGPLSDSELEYEKYDFDKLYPFTTAHKIYKNLKVYISEVDAKLKTNFLKELEGLVEKEKIEFEKKDAEKTENIKNDYSIPINDPYKEEEEEKVEVDEKTNTNKKRTTKTISITSNINDVISIYPHVQKLTEEEKAFITGINKETNEIIYAQNSGELIPCPIEECKKSQPEEISTLCLFCGTEFE